MSTWRDWTEEVDEASGEKYFYNNVTGESSWEAPPGYLAAIVGEASGGDAGAGGDDQVDAGSSSSEGDAEEVQVVEGDDVVGGEGEADGTEDWDTSLPSLYIHLYCEDLPVGCSPLVRLFAGPDLDELGETELVEDDENPSFEAHCQIQFAFDIRQVVRLEVHDGARGHCIGVAHATIEEVVQDGGEAVYALRSDAACPDDFDVVGSIGVVGELISSIAEVSGTNDEGEEVYADPALPEFKDFETWRRGLGMRRRLSRSAGTRSFVQLDLAAANLDKHGTFGKSDPYVVVSRFEADGSKMVICKSEKHKRTLNPNWMPRMIPEQTLCSCNHSMPILIEVFDWERARGARFIGATRTNLAQLLKNSGSSLPLINKAKQAAVAKKQKKYVNSGILILREVKLVTETIDVHDFQPRDKLRDDYQHDKIKFVLEQRMAREARRPPKERFLRHLWGGLTLRMFAGVNMADSTGPRAAVSAIVRAVSDVVCSYAAAGTPITACGFGACVDPSVAADADQESPVFKMRSRDGSTAPGTPDELIAAYEHSADIIGSTNTAESWVRVLDEAIECIIAERMSEGIDVDDPTRSPGAEQHAQVYHVILLVTEANIPADQVEGLHERLRRLSNFPATVILAGVGELADYNETYEALHVEGVERSNVIFAALPNASMDVASNTSSYLLEPLPAQFVSYAEMAQLFPTVNEEGVRLWPEVEAPDEAAHDAESADSGEGAGTEAAASEEPRVSVAEDDETRTKSLARMGSRLHMAAVNESGNLAGRSAKDIAKLGRSVLRGAL